MHPTRARAAAVILAAFPLALAPLIVIPVPADAATATSVRLRTAIGNLPVAAETRGGYDRAKFQGWIKSRTATAETPETRSWLLSPWSRSEVVTSRPVAGAPTTTARWHETPPPFDIDHVVALAEAWDSGARRWTAATRSRYANDLGDSRTLIAVSASSNRSKGDRDPADWMPPLAKCRYIQQWVAVKIRWRLKVNRTEKTALSRRASECDNVTVRVRRASIQTTN